MVSPPEIEIHLSPPSPWISTRSPPVAARHHGRRCRRRSRRGGLAGRVESPSPAPMFERRHRLLELTPSPPKVSNAEGPHHSRGATPPRARRWRLLAGPLYEREALFGDPPPTPPSPPPLPPPIAVEEEGPTGTNTCGLGDPSQFPNGMSNYFPFHPTTEEWAEAEAEASAIINEEIKKRKH